MKFTSPRSPGSMLCYTFILMFFSLPAHSAEGEKDQWQFQLAPYAWLAGQNGTVATFANLPSVDIDVDFWDDVVGNINGALFLVGEARKDRYAVFMDVAYTDIEDENGTLGPLFSSATVRTKSWIVTTAGQYRMVDNATAFLDFLAGFRYWSVETSLALSSGLLPGREVSSRKDWFDPLIGVKGNTGLGDSNFFVSGTIMIGGFGAGSDFMWDASIHLGYQWGKMFSTTIGYRYLDVDFEKDGFLYDISQSGPVLGLSWRF